MTEPSVIAAGAGELVGDSADRRVEILCDDDPLHATWSRFGPGRDGADLHVHHDHTDLFYVLEGELTIRLGPGGEPAAVPAGALARVPPDVIHGFRNGGDTEVRYLNLHAPGQGFADYMRARRDGRDASYDQHPPPAGGGEPITGAVIGGAELLADRPERRVALLADTAAIGIAEIRVARDGAGAPEVGGTGSSLDALYVLDGELTLAGIGDGLSAGAGSWVRLPPGAPAAALSSGPEPASFLLIRVPGGDPGDSFRRVLSR